MKTHNAEMVDALVDGQLQGWRAWLAKRHVSNCPICALEYRHQTHVRRMLAANPDPRQMPGSADDFWGRVRRTIENQSATAPAAAPATLRMSLADWLWNRPNLVPAMGFAVLLIACGAIWLRFGRPSTETPAPQLVVQQQPPDVSPQPETAPSEPDGERQEPVTVPQESVAAAPQAETPAPQTEARLATVEHMETTVPHAVATAVPANDSGVTVIWVSGLPWTDNMTDMQTLFAHPYDYFDI